MAVEKRGMSAVAKQWRSKVLDLLFPPKCIFCGKLTGDGDVCAACEKSVFNCELQKRTLPGGLVCAASLPYEGVVRRSILRFKFEGRDHYAKEYGALLARTAALEFADSFDLVTWIPLSKERKRERGYDQAELLAKAMCEHWGVMPLRTLEKTGHNPAQSGIRSAEERRANVLGVYEAVKREQFAGKRVLLVDDIITTGSTAAEAARVLRLMGAAEVLVLTLATAGEKL